MEMKGQSDKAKVIEVRIKETNERLYKTNFIRGKLTTSISSYGFSFIFFVYFVVFYYYYICLLYLDTQLRDMPR